MMMKIEQPATIGCLLSIERAYIDCVSIIMQRSEKKKKKKIIIRRTPLERIHHYVITLGTWYI